MANIKNQRMVQMGEEVTFGTDVEPTVELSGIDPDAIQISPSIVTEIVRGARGGIVPGRDTITVRHEVQGCSIGGWVIYEQIPYWLNLLHFATEGATRAYAAPTSAQVTPDLATLVFGLGDLVYNITSVRAASMTFTWNWGEPLKWSMDLMGHSVKADAFAAVAETAATGLTYALAAHNTVYIDALSGVLGATPYACCLGGSLTINPNRKYQRCVGSLYPTGTYDSPYWDITGTLILEETTTSAGFADAIIAGATSKLIRIKFTNGLAAGNERSLTFDIAALVHVTNLMTDSDDVSTVELSFEPIEEGDWTTPGGGDLDGYFEITSVCADADLWA